MEQMTQRLMLAAVLGVLLGVGLGFSPIIQPNQAPKPQLFTQQTNPSAARFRTQAAPVLLPVTVGVLVGLATAACAFLISRHSTA